jgi:hypothetical protein
MDTPRRRQQAQEASLLPSGTVKHRTGRTPRHGPFVPGRVGPTLIQQLNRTKLETLHKHLETRLKITVHHPRTYKTSRGLILPREIYYALTNIKCFREEDRSKDEEV